MCVVRWEEQSTVVESPTLVHWNVENKQTKKGHSVPKTSIPLSSLHRLRTNSGVPIPKKPPSDPMK